MDNEPAGGNVSLFERAKAIILKPNEEWPKIAAETKSQSEILTAYVLPLVAIGPVATLIGSQVFGYGAFGFSYRPSLMSSLTTAIVSFVLGIVGVFILTFIADFLAPKFDGQQNRHNAFKLVAYGATAAWVAGIFGIIPSLAFFGLLGLYSIYLFYTGSSVLMSVPEAKRGSYTAVTFICAILLYFVVGLIAGAVTGFGGASSLAKKAESQGTISLPGGGSVDLGDAENMQKQIENAVSGQSNPVAVSDMQTLLPASIGPYKRTATETVKAGAIGSTAEGTYTTGDKSFSLRVVDMSGLGALAGMGAAMGIEQSREDADGYERTGTVDGQMQTESWNKTRSRGKFGRVIANRFMVEADGEADTIDQLKAAVATIDPGDLQALVK